MKKVTLELDAKQLEALFEIAYLGNWLVNAHRVTGHKAKYKAVSQLVYSKLEEAGIKNSMRFIHGEWVMEDERRETHFFISSDRRAS